MPCTTLDIDARVLKKLKRRRREEGKTLGQLASELMARALGEGRDADELAPLEWTSRPLGLKVNLQDQDALWKVLDQR